MIWSCIIHFSCLGIYWKSGSCLLISVHFELMLFRLFWHSIKSVLVSSFGMGSFSRGSGGKSGSQTGVRPGISSSLVFWTQILRYACVNSLHEFVRVLYCQSRATDWRKGNWKLREKWRHVDMPRRSKAFPFHPFFQVVFGPTSRWGQSMSAKQWNIY